MYNIEHDSYMQMFTLNDVMWQRYRQSAAIWAI